MPGECPIPVGWVIPADEDLSPHFRLAEAACHCCGRIPSMAAVRETAAMLEEVRRMLGGRPIRVLSWCRCPAYNARVGGAPNSYHLRGMAVDIVVRDLSPRRVQAILAGHQGGLGRYPGFTHVDRGPRRRWRV